VCNETVEEDNPIITPITPAILHRPDEKPDIILMMDSNGTFILDNKLFPNKKVAKLWCPTRESYGALDCGPALLPQSSSFTHGSIYLLAQQERVATSLRGVIEQASTIFPLAKIVISTLLQRRHVHSATIQRINASLSRDCVLRHTIPPSVWTVFTTVYTCTKRQSPPSPER
jgi:hypothetical protein